MVTGRRSFLGVIVAGITAGMVAKMPTDGLQRYVVTSDGWTSGNPSLRRGDTFTISGIYSVNPWHKACPTK